jgi:hypothetical protein
VVDVEPNSRRCRLLTVLRLPCCSARQMRRWNAWVFASTCGQRTSCHDVIAGAPSGAIDPYLAACATLVLVASIP